MEMVDFRDVHDVSINECATCFGLYMMSRLIQRLEMSLVTDWCVWMHAECLEKCVYMIISLLSAFPYLTKIKCGLLLPGAYGRRL